MKPIFKRAKEQIPYKTALICFLSVVLNINSNTLNAQSVNVDNSGINISSGAYMVMDGNLIMQNSGVVNNSGNIKFGGNLTNNGGLNNTGTSTVELNGSATQNVTGVTTFNNLTVNNTAANVILNNDQNVNNTLTLTSGKVDLNGNTLTLGTSGSNGTLSGGSSSAYFVSNNANSKFSRFTTTTLTSFSFPMGDATNYSPLSLQFNSGGSLASTSKITVDVIASSLSAYLGTSTNYLNRYWTVSPTNIPVNTLYSVNYTYPASDVTGVEANLFPAKHDAAGWIQPYGSGALFMMGNGSVNPGTHTISWTGLYSFSDFSGNGNGTPLPISLLSFDAYPVLNHIQTVWATATQTNNDYFTIERSKDSQYFEAVGTIAGAGNSNEHLDYTFTDTKPYDGVSYYRLKQTDFDGKFTYSDVKSVTFNQATANTEVFSVYPNPTSLRGITLVTGQLNNESINIKLIDIIGHTIQQNTLSVNQNGDKHFVNFDEVPVGIYFLEITDGAIVKNIKIIIEGK